MIFLKHTRIADGHPNLTMLEEGAMRIIDLQPELEELYFQCLEDWSEEMTEAGDHKPDGTKR